MKYLKANLAVLLVVMLVCGCAKPAKDNSSTKNDVTKPTQTESQTETKTEEPTTKPFVPTEVSLVMIGDMLLHENVPASALGPDGTYNFDHLFKFIKDDVTAADIAIANEEVILGGTELGLSGYPMFNGPYEAGDGLVNAGFNVILHATNHTLDKGLTGINNNINFWKTKHPNVAFLGMNESKEAQDKIYVYQKGDIKITILNYTYGTNGIPIPQSAPYVVNLLDEEKCAADIKKAKELADFVIVCPHWGTEYVHYATDYQKTWAKFFLDNGVDLVLGTHPHVIEPIEWLENDNHKMLVYYSLGNYVSGQDQAATMIGAMAEVTITNDETGKVFIKEYGVQPLITHKERGYQKLLVYKLEDYTDELVKKNYIIGQDSRFNLKYCKDLCNKVFEGVYKID